MRRFLAILLLGFVCSASTFNDQFAGFLNSTLRNGLGLEYKFTSNANDSSGNGYDGTLTDGASVSGGVLICDGVNDYLDVNDPLNSVFDGPFTISFWVELDDGKPSSDTFFFGEQDTTVDRSLMWINSAGVATFSYFSANVQGRAESDAAMFTNGAQAWAHLTITVSESQITIYKDNSEVTLDGTNDGDMSGVTMASYDCVANMVIMARNLSTISPSNFTGGSVDNFRIYDRVLTASEITQLFNEGHD